MNLRIKDKVKVIDEDFVGEVLKIDGSLITVSCEDGFEYVFQKHELLLLKSNGEVEHTTRDSYGELLDIKNDKSKGVNESIEFNLNGKKPVIDLHLEELAPIKVFENNHEALIFQLEVVKEVIRVASQKKIRNVVFVHGVGQGRLKTELRSLLISSYPEIEFFDGSYTQFGLGATEIVIHRLHGK
ncbi:MAG: Smr/MutS family protein [Bacteroidetes bacterium]|nr:Smr/MutS family protein [Bacteroidota bacterium]